MKYACCIIPVLALQGCVPPEKCRKIETKYGSVEPSIDYFIRHRITGNVVCSNGEKQPRIFEMFPEVGKCPEDPKSRDSLVIESEINMACLNYYKLQEQVSKRLVTDLLGSPYVVKKDFNISAECTAKGPEVSIDASIYGDLRRVWNDTMSFVQLKLDKIEYSDKSFKDRKILALLEPVWDFINRVQAPESPPILTIDISGNEGIHLEIESSRSRLVHVKIHKTDSGFQIVELVDTDDRTLPDQPNDCSECMSTVTVSECTSKFLTNTCGAVVDHKCAVEWNSIKKICPTCRVPL